MMPAEAESDRTSPFRPFGAPPPSGGRLSRRRLAGVGAAVLGAGLTLPAIVPAQPALGLLPGVIFALKNIYDSVNINQQNRLHPYYLVYVGSDGDVVVDHTEVKRLLDLIRTSCRGRAEPIQAVCRLFNERTQDGRKMEQCSEFLSAAIRSMIEVKEEKDLDSLFSAGRTTALVHTIAGLDDFELIAFLVVEEAPA